MASKVNLMVKVMDSNMAAVKKALETAGIKVDSIIQIHKEEVKEEEKNPALVGSN